MNSEFQKLEGKDYLQNFYRYKLHDKKTKNYLVTLDDGEFIFLNNSVLTQLKKGKILDQTIYKTLLSKGIIVTPENISKLINSTKKKYGFLSNGTSLHIVIPTHRCNLKCTYCFADTKEITEMAEENNLDDETAKQIVDFIFTSPSKAITIEFQGGEATLEPETIKLMTTYAKELNKTKQKNLLITIVTNLTLMTDELANWLIDNGVTICTSLDGPDFIHNKNRFILAKQGTQIGTHKLVTTWIDKINKIYKEKNIQHQVNAIPTISAYSLPYYKEIIDEHIKYGLKTIDIRALTQIGEIQKNDTLNYSSKDFNIFYQNCLKYIDKLKEKGIIMDERTKNLYKTKIIKNLPGYHTEYESPCGATTGQITYHSDGKIYTCHEGLGREEFQIGDVKKDTWAELFQKEQTQKAILNSMIEQNVICDRCVYKPYCGTCMVENFYNFDKFNFYPTKTQHHHTTILQSKKIFNKMFKQLDIK